MCQRWQVRGYRQFGRGIGAQVEVILAREAREGGLNPCQGARQIGTQILNILDPN